MITRKQPRALHFTASVLAVLGFTACQVGPTDPNGTGPEPGGPSFLIVAPNAFTQLDAGDYHNCAVRDDGVVECWGSSDWGKAPPTKTAANGMFTEVSAARHHSCAVRSDGVVECWGYNGLGQAPATRTPVTGSFTGVSGGSAHSCAVRDDGDVECWGYDGAGAAPPIKPPATGMFTQVRAGTSHTCALRDDGVVECWGDNVWGQAPPTKTAANGAFIQVATGSVHTCAVRADGVVECWGYNADGQAPATRTAVTGSFTGVTGGAAHGCAVRGDGVTECWGTSWVGAAPPTKTAVSGAFTQVSAGANHTCALRSDGFAECWGEDELGQAPPVREPSTTVHNLPSAEFSATPNPVTLGQSFTLALFDVEVEGEGSHTFTFAFDCGDGSGYGAFGASNTAVCPTTALGTFTVKGTVRDADGDESPEYSESVSVIYDFGGFVGSVDAPPTFNVAKAGSAVPAKFSLGGDQGLAILATGYPKSQPIGCDASSPADPIEETVNAGNSSLSYDATTGLYTYVWKTDKAWANTCRLLTLRLADGTDYTALFRFYR